MKNGQPKNKSRRLLSLLKAFIDGDPIKADAAPVRLSRQDKFIRVYFIFICGLVSSLSIHEALERRVGREHLVVGVSADHGFCPNPAWGTHRYDTEAALEDLNAALPAKVAVFDGFGLWYVPGADRATLDRTVAEAASRAWAGWVDEIVPVATLGDRASVNAEAVRFSHRDGRSPDAVVFPKPGFIPEWYEGKGSTHGSIQEYDRHVPGILWGAGVKPERLDSPTAPYAFAPGMARELEIAW